MPVVPLHEESRQRAGGFYVPQFEIKVAGQGLPEYVVRDVIELSYKDNIEEIDSFQLTLNNWDESQLAFKYSGSRDDGEPGSLSEFFEPCGRNREVEVRMGYAGNLELMMKGTFTTLEPNFSSSAAPTLRVRGLNMLHRLRRKKYDGEWHNKKDSEIAENIATLRDRELNNDRRFPLPIVTDRSAKAREEAIFYLAQKKEYDIDFLWKRAKTRGYVVVIQEENDDHPQRLYFGPSGSTEDPVVYELEWGRSLVDFKPTLTTANQYKSVTVNGWDRNRQRAISEKVDMNDPEIRRLNANLHGLIMDCDAREEHVVTEPVFSACQARERARAILMDQHKEMVKASVTTVGLPRLRAGSKVRILGVGPRLSGTYFVTESNHVINDNGYATQFKARREDEGGGDT